MNPGVPTADMQLKLRAPGNKSWFLYSCRENQKKHTIAKAKASCFVQICAKRQCAITRLTARLRREQMQAREFGLAVRQ